MHNKRRPEEASEHQERKRRKQLKPSGDKRVTAVEAFDFRFLINGD